MTTSLQMSSLAPEDHDAATRLLQRAYDCANSETCSLEMAEDYLREVMHVQSGCAAGTLSESSPICSDVGFAAEVVASLNAKIEENRPLLKRFLSARQAELEELTVAATSKENSMATTLSPIASVVNSPLRIVYLGAALFYLSLLLSSLSGVVTESVSPFTLQEWMWAARDGYLDDMVSQVLKYGGLPMEGSMDAVTGIPVPFTAQEWWWSFRDGYLGNMISHSMNNNGVLDTVDSAANGVTVPFTPQEWWWSFRDGYLGNMISDSFRNGGITVTSADDMPQPFTAQEWWWAAGDGYLGNMISHTFRNGGL